jgi:hypothetical protein
MSEITMNELTENSLSTALDWAYDKAINGVPGLDSAEELAKEYMAGNGTLQEKVNSLINWQITKAGTSGFLTGLGGIITMPVAIPANLASVLYIQIRMIATIAHMGGYDLKSDKVKSLVYACLAGNGAKEILKEVGINLATKLAISTIKSISGKTIVAINQKVGFRLLTKFGEKGIVNLGKAVPLIGGFIGGTIDSVTTNTIGTISRDIFIGKLDKE